MMSFGQGGHCQNAWPSAYQERPPSDAYHRVTRWREMRHCGITGVVRLMRLCPSKGRKTGHEKCETNSRHRESPLLASHPPGLESPAGQWLGWKRGGRANSPAGRLGDLNEEVIVVVAQADANADHLGMRTSRFV